MSKGRGEGIHHGDAEDPRRSRNQIVLVLVVVFVFGVVARMILTSVFLILNSALLSDAKNSAITNLDETFGQIEENYANRYCWFGANGCKYGAPSYAQRA